MSNAFKKLQDLLAPGAVQVGTVSAFANGIATVDLPGGGQVRAKGQTQVAAKVFVQDGKVLGAAPDLPVTVSDI